LYAVQQGMFLKPNILPAGQFLAKRPTSIIWISDNGISMKP